VRGEGPLDTAVGTTASGERVRDWILVLSAGGIEHRLETGAEGWRLLVSARDAPMASGMLAAFEAESREPAVPAPPAAGPGGWWLGVAITAALAAVFVWTGPRAGGHAWFARGSASAARILDGELWRTVTALTLHADLVHLLGNTLACLVLLPALARAVGSGVALWLALLSGAAGNGLTALVHGTHHVSVGASTATFGAVGLLAGLQCVAWRRQRSTRRRPWVIIAAAVVLLGLLGTGTGADVLAHVFGLLAGGVLGLAAGLALRAVPGPRVQAGLIVAGALAVAGCWALALA
jgi:membrane associated rhomboid family serine protease